MRELELSELILAFCTEQDISLKVSNRMPAGYETAFGTYDVTVNTLYLNQKLLENAPAYEILFYLYHELRHALQYLRPELFDEQIRKSIFYVVLYDGTCFKLIDQQWHKGMLKDKAFDFTSAYLNMPYERDANAFAYQKVKSISGHSTELERLYQLWQPDIVWEDDEYQKLLRLIDEEINSKIE